MRGSCWLVPILATLVSGCSDGEEGDGSDGPESASIAAGDATLRVDARTGKVTLERGALAILTFPADAFVLGSVAEVDDLANYDPAPLMAGDPAAKEPEGLAFQGGTRLRIESASDTEISLRVTHAGGLASRVVLSRSGDDRFRGRLEPVDATSIAYLGLAPEVGADEAFYGLGEYFDSVNHRGKVRAMQLEVNGLLESSNNEAHVPVPFVTGTSGFGLFVENPYPAAFDVAKSDAKRIRSTFGTGLASKEGLTFHLFSAAHPLDVTRHYYEVSGYPRLPARWALGPWVWRDENDDQAQVEADIQAIRDLDLATTAIWIDRPYATAVNTFDFDATKFPDEKAMIDKAHAAGLRMALWHTPYLDEKDPATAALRDEATKKGYYPLERGLLLNKWGPPIDLTNPEAFAWWQGLAKKYADLGVQGFKLDYAEDVVPGVFGARNVWKFHDGSDERTMHARYQLFYHRVYAELFPEEGAFLLCRGGTYGDQVNVSVVWPGDLDASFAKSGEKVTEKGETYTAVGGLPAALIAGLSLGPSGFPFFGADTGGYRHSPPDKELFTRWFQVTALSPVMQIGTSSNDVAWEPTADNGFDAEMLGWYRTYTRLHLRLFPYIWTYAKRLSSDGRPIQRALGLAYPELGEHPNDVFLLGDSLLAAPVVERGKTVRDVPLPPGEWQDWFTGKSISGGKTVSVEAPMGSLPLFVKEGGLVPLLRPTIDTLSPATVAGVDSYATTPGVLWVRVVPGPASEFELFDGARVGQEDRTSSVLLTSSDGSEFAQGVVFELQGFGAKPKSVEDGGSSLGERASLTALELESSGWAFDNGALWVKVAGGNHGITVTR